MSINKLEAKQLNDWDKNLVFQNAGTYKIEGIAAGTAGTDAVNVNQMNAYVAGVNLHPAANLATTAAINIGTFAAGDTIDSIVTVIGNRILVKDQASTAENGIYEVTSGGLVRAADADGTPANEVMAGDIVSILSGTINGGKAFTLLGAAGVNIVPGVGAQVWTLFFVSTLYTFANGLTELNGDVTLGGTLNQATTITGAYDLGFGTSNSRISSFSSFVSSGNITLNKSNGGGANILSITELNAGLKYDNANIVTTTTNKVSGFEAKFQDATTGYINNIKVQTDSIVSKVNDSFNGPVSTLTQDTSRLTFTGYINVGVDAAAATAGDIKYVGADFFGYNGTSWVSFTAGATPYTAGTAITIATDNSINVDYDNATITLDIAGNLQVGMIATSNITNFATAVKDTVITSSIFLNTGNVDFTIVNGVSVVANLGTNSVGDAELKSTNVGSIGQIVSLGNSAGDFTYVDAAVNKITHRFSGLVANTSSNNEVTIKATPFTGFAPLSNSFPVVIINGQFMHISDDATGAVYFIDGLGAPVALNALTAGESLAFNGANAGWDVDNAIDYLELRWESAS